jgi:hypothetical protein
VISRAVNFTVSRQCFTGRLVTSQPGECRGPPAIVGCLIHAGEYWQQLGQIGEGKKAEHQLPRGSQQQVPAGTHINTGHLPASCLSSQAGSRPDS